MLSNSLSNLFKGREGPNNREIISLLLKFEKLSPYELCSELEKVLSREIGPEKIHSREKKLRKVPSRGERLRQLYPTVLGRVKDLESKGIIEKRDEGVASKSHKIIRLYSISPYGLNLLAGEAESSDVELQKLGKYALKKCQEILKTHYRTFLQVYQIEKSESDSKIFKYDFDNWIEDNRDITIILKFFGYYPLIGEPQAILAFRRMIDIGFMLLASKKAFINPMLGIEGISTWPFETLAEIALKKKEFNKLYKTIERTDTPLYAHLKPAYENQLVEFLAKGVNQATAKELVNTSYLKNVGKKSSAKYQLPARISKKPLKDEIENAQKNLQPYLGKKWLPSINIILVENRRLCIIASKPEEITAEWKKYSDLYTPNKDGIFILNR